MVLSTQQDDDLGGRLLSAGGAAAFLSDTIRDTASLREVRAVAAECESELARAAAVGTNKADLSLRGAAQQSLHDARARLEEIRARATSTLFEHEERRRALRAILNSFEELAAAKTEANAVVACRGIADAYVRALHPLALHQRDGT